MRILIITSYFEPDSGAAAVRLSRLAKLLRQRGHEITILTTLPSYPQGIIAEGYRDAWEVIEQRDGLNIIRTWLWATSSPRISRKFISQISFMLTASLRGLSIARPDVVLIEAQPVFTSLAGVFFSRLKRVPYVLNVSDLWPDHLLSVGALTASHPIYRLARWLVDSTYHGAGAIAAMSPAWAEAIQRHVGAQSKIRVIYNGVNLERFRPGLDESAFRQKYDLGNHRLVTFIGTFATQYDFETMLVAANRLIQHENILFVFIGDGSQSALMSESMAKNVRWIRWINHDEIPLAWSASTITFWAMRDQDLYRGTIPAKMYEAMATGTPIVAAGEGIASEIINRCYAGLTVPSKDIDGLVSAITRLLNDEDLRVQFSHSARAYAEQNFDPEKVADLYEDVLKKDGSFLKPMPKLSVNFIIHNDFSHIRPALQSLFTPTQIPCEVHVIINTPDDLEVQALKNDFPQVQFFVNATPLGFAANHNQFMRRVTSQYMALLNDDIILYPDTLDTLVKYLEAHPDVGVVGANLQNADSTPQVSVYSDPTLLRMIYKISGLSVLTRQNGLLRNWLTRMGIARLLKVESLQSQSTTRLVPVVKGAVMVVRCEAYLQVGPMDETTLGYGEEVDWHLRMRQAGWQVAYVSEAWVTHFGLGQARLQLTGQMLLEDRKAILNYWLKYRPRWQVALIRLNIIVFHSSFSLILFYDPTRSKTHRRVAQVGFSWTPTHRKG